MDMKAKKTVETANAYPTPLFDEVGYLKLDSNESDFGPSPKVLDAIKSVNAEEIKFYPFYGELLEKIAKFHGIKPENIILTAGADEAISAVLGTFLEVGQNVLTVKPSFVMPKIYSKIKGLNYIEIPYKDKWIFPKNEFFKEINNADLIHLTTPNSPTGEIIERSVIEEIIIKAGDKVVIIDETYANYANETNIDLLEGRDNIFITRSFSKDFALAGLRLGYIISCAKNIVELRKYLSPYNVSTITVKAGLAALEDVEYLENVKAETEKSKSILKAEFEKLGAKVYNSKTNFLCVDFGLKSDFIYKRLLDNKIKVKYFNQTPHLENCFRIGIPKLENVQKILTALKPRPTIAFDMDGVIVDASKSYRVAVQKTFIHFTSKIVRHKEISELKMQGGLNNDWDLTDYLLKKHGYNIDYDKIVEVFQEYYKELADVEDILIDDEFLNELSQNYNLAVFTGRMDSDAFFTLEKHAIKKYFCPIITLNDVTIDHQKPDCRGIEMIKERIITDKIYYLGDTIDDMTCALSANVTGIGILPPQDKSENLKKLLKSKNAVVVLNETKELLDYLNAKVKSER